MLPDSLLVIIKFPQNDIIIPGSDTTSCFKMLVSLINGSGLIFRSAPSLLACMLEDCAFLLPKFVSALLSSVLFVRSVEPVSGVGVVLEEVGVVLQELLVLVCREGWRRGDTDESAEFKTALLDSNKLI